MRISALFYQNPAGYLTSLLLLVFSCVSFYLNNSIAFIFLIAFAFVLLANILYSVLSFKSTIKYVEQVNKSLSSEKIDSVDSFPLPCVMSDTKGNVIWYNEEFKANIVPDGTHTLNMSDFFAGFNYSKFATLQTADAEFDDKKYSVFITKVKSASNPMLCFYFFDDTYMKNTATEFELSRPFVMAILVDNIEQLSRQLTDSKFAKVSAGIERKIEKWLRNERLIFKKMGNGSFLVIGEKRNLDNLTLDKFSVLKTVKEYELTNLPVNATLSIGVGVGADFVECEERAKKALDMALGRGGDQAAVLTDDGYIYYGGMSNLSNDNSRVSPRQTAVNIATLIKKHKKVIIMGHKFSDYDAIGSAMGICFFAEANGVPAFVVADKKTTLSQSLITLSEKRGFNAFISVDEAISKCDENTVLFITDTHRLALTDVPELYNSAGARVVIDHHRRSDDFINDADIFYHLPSPSSTCEMVTELIEYSTIQETLTPVVATALLSGIVLDTREYVLRTSRRTFDAAAFLRDNKADTVAVKKLFSVDSEMINIKNEIIADAVMYRSCMISLTDNSAKDIRVITSRAADEMLNIEGALASFVIFYTGDNIVQISARSLGEENVQLIMERLGGGGHGTMAAAQIKNADLEAAKSMLTGAIDEYYSAK